MSQESKTKTVNAKSNKKTPSKPAKTGTAKDLELSSRTQVRNATAQADKLLRGIDNEVVAIQKAQKSLEERTKRVSESAVTISKILGGISNLALTEFNRADNKPSTAKADSKPAPVKMSQAKTAGTKPQSTVAKQSPKTPSKPASSKANVAQSPKPAKPTKTAAKPAVAKTTVSSNGSKPTKVTKPESSERPSLKTVIDGILMAGPMKASAIYNEACKRYGRWSRQSLYSALKDTKYSKTGNGADAVFSASNAVSDDEANALIKKVEASGVVSNVV